MKRTIILSILTIITLSFINIVNAATTTMEVNRVNEEVKKGDIVTITISIKDTVNAGKFMLTYNKKILKYKEDNFSATQNDTYEEGTSFNFFDTTGINELKISLEVIGNGGSTKIGIKPDLLAIGTTPEGRIEDPEVISNCTVKIHKEKASILEILGNIVIVVICIVIIILILNIIAKKSKKNKKSKRKHS